VVVLAPLTVVPLPVVPDVALTDGHVLLTRMNSVTPFVPNSCTRSAELK
jgi:hypothetical protein